MPDGLYAPIDQQAVLLTTARERAPAREFMAFLRSPAAQRIIRASGYLVPPRGAPPDHRT